MYEDHKKLYVRSFRAQTEYKRERILNKYVEMNEYGCGSIGNKNLL